MMNPIKIEYFKDKTILTFDEFHNFYDFIKKTIFINGK